MSMRAFVLTKYGGPEAAELRDVPIPEPRRGEVRVRVCAAGLNPVDFKTRAGMLKLVSNHSLPIVFGSELSGVVEALGEGVAAFAIGDEVFTRVDKRALGAFAERVCVREDLLASKPKTLDFTRAAAVPLAAITALHVLRDELGVTKGTRVFIPGGAGGVGTFAIQIAKRLGAEVTTTASPRGKDLVTRLGADVVVDYTATDFARDLKDYDCAFDLVGGDALSACFDAVRRGGRVVSIAGAPEPETARRDLGGGTLLATAFWFASLTTRYRAWRRGVDYRYVFMRPSGAELGEIATLIDAKAIEVIVDRVFPFADIASAFAYLEQGRAKGKVVVEMGTA
jgi:NADPH:quinone reductase-like Zn-dependent oxidoreductase